MDLALIDMPRKEARVKFLEYRRSVRERHTEEDRAIMAGYRALSQGKQLLHLNETIVAGGKDARGRPRLAVVRADVRRCALIVAGNGRIVFDDADKPRWGRGSHVMTSSVSVRESDLFVPDTCFEQHWKDQQPHRHEITARAVVPLIPAPLRPKHKLSNYHILWEAEWTRGVPRDPALLKHLRGDLYVVLAVWDLTPLERAVLGGRL